MACTCPSAKLSAAGQVSRSKCYKVEGHQLRALESGFDAGLARKFRTFLTPPCSQSSVQNHRSLTSFHSLQQCSLGRNCCRPSLLLKHGIPLQCKRKLQSMPNRAAAASSSAEPHKPASEESVLQVVHALQDNKTAAQTAAALIARLDGQGREVILSALFQTGKLS